MRNVRIYMQDGFNVYYLYNKLNNEIFYIGSTTRFLKYRLQEHLRIKNTKVYEYISKVGAKNIDIALLEKCDSQKSMFERETYWTSYYEKKYNLCNIKIGTKHTDITKFNIGHSRIYAKGKDSPLYGIPRPEWLKKQQSEKMRGRFVGDKNPMFGVHKTGKDCVNSKPIRCINTGEVFDSITDASKKLNINRCSIGEVCNGKRKFAGKLNGEKMVWEFVNSGEEGDLL